MRRHRVPAEADDLLATVNDPMSTVAGNAGVWSLPSVPDGAGGAELPPEHFDYSGGMFAQDADAIAPALHPELLPMRTDLDVHSYEAPHEATHRRYEPPFIVRINQAASGFTLLAPPTGGLHYIKLLGCWIGLDAAGGTLRFVQGSADGTSVADLTGNIGPLAGTPLMLPTVDPPNPHLFTSPDQALGIFTAVSKAQGWAILCNSPYDQ